jgi:hypothetical protein
MMASGSAHAPVDRSFRARDEVVARSDRLIVGDPCAESRAGRVPEGKLMIEIGNLFGKGAPLS